MIRRAQADARAGASRCSPWLQGEPLRLTYKWPRGSTDQPFRPREQSPMTSQATSTGQSAQWRAVTAASIGNALEWFDFVLYGYFAATMAELFFPTGNPTVSLL